MANFSYGVSSLLPEYAEEYAGYGNEDDVLQRSADEDLDDMVQRNIRDVLQQAGIDDAGGGTYDEDPDRPDQEYSGKTLVSSSSLQVLARDGAGTSARLASSAGAASGDSGTAQATSRPPDFRRPGGEPHKQRTSAMTSAAAAGPAKSRGGGDASVGPGGGAAVARRSGEAGEVLGTGAAGVSSSTSVSSLLDVPGQPEASLRLHKARIKALEDDLSQANKLLSDREKQLGESLRELKELRGQAASWARDKKVLEGQLDRAKKQAAEAEAMLRNTESRVREMAKADSRAERERRASEAEVRARDVRLQRALEEVERYKQLLNEVRAQERDAKGSVQQDAGRLLAENRKLERQRTELITAFKKQLKLIEVLKRQKVHLEAARALQFSEEEFLKTLEIGAT